MTFPEWKVAKQVEAALLGVAIGVSTLALGLVALPHLARLVKQMNERREEGCAAAGARGKDAHATNDR